MGLSTTLIKLRLHGAFKPVLNWTSLETPGVNALNRFSNRLVNQFVNHFQEVFEADFNAV